MDALNAAEGELRRNRVDEMLAIRKLLTPDQLTSLSAMWRDDDDDDAEDEEHGDRERGHDEGDDDDEEGEHHGEREK